MNGDHGRTPASDYTAHRCPDTAHRCPDWDGLMIDCNDDEYHCCTCPQYNGMRGERYIEGVKKPANCCPDCDEFRFTQEETSELIQVLEEAVYLLNPTEEDMQKKAGVYRVVTALEKMKEKNT